MDIPELIAKFLETQGYRIVHSIDRILDLASPKIASMNIYKSNTKIGSVKIEGTKAVLILRDKHVKYDVYDPTSLTSMAETIHAAYVMAGGYLNKD